MCPACGGHDHAIVGKRRLYLCHGCRKQTSVIAGTLFENSLVPLTKWFQATWLIMQSKNSISTLELSRQIGVKWDTVFDFSADRSDEHPYTIHSMYERSETKLCDKSAHAHSMVAAMLLSGLSPGKYHGVVFRYTDHSGRLIKPLCGFCLHFCSLAPALFSFASGRESRRTRN